MGECPSHSYPEGLADGSAGRESTCSAGDTDVGQPPGQEDPLELEMAIHSGSLAWGNPTD